MEKTAVEYLIEQLEFALPDIEWSNYKNETNKALEIEKQQIVDAFDGFPLSTRNSQNGEEYYNETYKQTNMESIEITNHKSRCCKAFVHYKHIENENFKSSEPYCSNCGKFPKTSLSAIKKALKILLIKKD